MNNTSKNGNNYFGGVFMRPQRYCFDGAIYHITTRCNNKEHILKKMILKDL
ncbi:hypothetical protein PL321_18225 [Caloramator sp. mosi_1]|uniref:hypothetical protein n=1 Tax=Caloramator sp. mosi_1 TaxID=3023090 RepID=UPI002360CDDC|nr:hypothetical protein [Caloramator sp. mosi_1]WDC84164.1 hypothetical protein PL321_18225 [Caloramator sp. mosi_1]